MAYNIKFVIVIVISILLFINYSNSALSVNMQEDIIDDFNIDDIDAYLADREDSLPDVNDNNIAENIEDSLPDVNDNNIAENIEDSLPDVNDNNIAENIEDSLPDVNDNNIAENIEDSLPDVNDNNIAENIEDNLPDVNDNNIAKHENILAPQDLSNPASITKKEEQYLNKMKDIISVNNPYDVIDNNLLQNEELLPNNDSKISIIRDDSEILTEPSDYIQVREGNNSGLSHEILNDVPLNVMVFNAYKALRLGHGESAILLFSQIISLDDMNFSALFGLASSYQQMNELDQAKMIYSVILDKYPNNKQALNNILLITSQQNPRFALIQLEDMKLANPKYSDIYAQKGIIYLKLGDYNNAVREFSSAIKLAPKNYDYQYNLALAFDKMGNSRSAIYFYSKILKAYSRGDIISGNIEILKNRYNYLRQNITKKDNKYEYKRAS